MILALEEQGLASLTYTPSNPNEVAKILNIPDRYRLQSLLPIGFPLSNKIKEKGASPYDKVYLNKWGRTLS